MLALLRRIIHTLGNNRLFASLVAVLVLALALIHVNWIFGGNALTSSDWPYFFRDLMTSWSPAHPFWINFDGLGRGISQGNFVFLFSVYSALAHLGANFELISRLLFFLPVLIAAPLGSFLAVKYVVRSNVPAIMGAFVYSLNTYFIVIQGGHMHLAVTYALAPLVYLFAMRTKGFPYFWMFFILCIVGLYDIRMSLVILIFAALLALFYKVKTLLDFRDFFIKMLFGGIVFIGFNLFWILPLAFTVPGPFGVNVFDQAALNWVVYADAFTLHHPFWSSEGVTDFVFQLPPFYVLLLPFFAFLPFTFKLVARRRELLFYGILCLGSMLFLMQGNSLLGGAYNLLYESLPLMSMFRESTKMFFITGFCFAMLVAFGIREVQRRAANSTLQRWVFGATLAGLILILLMPVRTYVLGNHVKAYRGETISQTMREVNALVSPDNTEQYRTLWVSRVPKFAHTTPQKPNLDALVLASLWGRATNPFDSMSYLRQSNVTGLLDFARIRYVVVPADKIDKNYHHYSRYDAAHYRDIVSQWGLKKVYDKNGTAVWENPGYKPLLYLATDITIADKLPGFSGLAGQPSSAYLFLDQNKWQNKTATARAIGSSAELQVFNPEFLRVEKNKVTTSAPLPDDTSYQLYAPKDDARTSVFAPLEPSDFNGKAIALDTPDIDGKNMYSNGSFEDNRPFTLIDANNFDRTSLASNRIKGTLVGDATDGKRALEITARRHIADLTQELTGFDKNAYYLISFDYKYIAGPAPLVGLDPYETEPTKRLTPLPTDKPGQWTKYQNIVSPGQFGDEAHLLIHVPTRPKQTFDSKTLVDNIRVYKLPFAPRAYLKSTSVPAKDLPLTAIQGDATRRIVTVNGLTKPRLFVFSETFDPNWKLYIRKAQHSASPSLQVAEARHVITNGYANGWWIDPSKLPASIQNDPGRYELTLEYAPQAWFWYGILFSGTITMSAATYYIVMRSWRRRRKWMLHK